MFELEPRQLFLFAVALFVPLYLIVMHSERWLLAWVCVTAGINIFDTTIFVNMVAGRIVGLLLIPQALRSLPLMIRVKPAQAVVVGYVYLILTGVVFGFLSPWSDGGLIRAFNQIAPGRTVIYLGRTAADISISFFIARQVIKRKCTDEVVRFLLFGTSIAALGGILEFASAADLYNIITGLSPFQDEFRVRGFNYEPRGLGLMVVYGFTLAILIWSRRRTWTISGLAVLHAAALFMTSSTSALVALGAGVFGFNLFDKRARKATAGVLLLSTLFCGCLAVSGNSYIAYFIEHSRLRLSGERSDMPSPNLIQNLANRMEIFDGPALLFLASNPSYLLSGTGPGLVHLPATAYVSQNALSAWTIDTGINSIPTMGLLLEVSNMGVIGLLLWLIICVSSFHAFSRLARYHPDEREKWLTMRAAFTIGAAIYSVQTSPYSMIWPIFVGTGIAAAHLVRTEKCHRKKASVNLAALL